MRTARRSGPSIRPVSVIHVFDQLADDALWTRRIFASLHRQVVVKIEELDVAPAKLPQDVPAPQIVKNPQDVGRRGAVKRMRTRLSALGVRGGLCSTKLLPLLECS